MTLLRTAVCLALASALPLSVQAPAQALDPALLFKPATTAWPTYNGDYSGRRYSTLKQINESNVKNLALQWIYPLNTAGAPPDAVYATPQIKSTPLEVNGILYFAVPDHAWAIDARTGREIWHYFWKTKGGIHIGNRGFGMYGNWLYFETPDNFLISLDARTGKERWHIEIADVKQEYFSTPAPVVIGNHILVGVGGDSLDVPGYLESRDPETGSLQWRWNTTPRPGEPGADSWPDRYSMEHGGGMTWMPGTYDPELNLYYLGTGNPNPVHAAQSRKGDNLWTCSIVALNPDTGKMVWYFQSSPHDTHDWDATQTPVLIDGEINGQKRKLVVQGSRNGYFFVLDRTNGKNILTAPFSDTMNWAQGVDAKGQPIGNRAKDPKPDGTLVSPSSNGATNWPHPTFDPDTGLFYLSGSDSWAVYYQTDLDEHPEGYGGRDTGVLAGSYLKAIDYKTGKTVWRHDWPAGRGAVASLLSTAGSLLFSGDQSLHLVALHPATGKILWHVGLGRNVSNPPITYELDGRQYILVGAADQLFAFALPQ
jgi:acido-empty-quinoprotein group A